MAKPKPPTGCRIKGGRYYRVFYAGKMDGKIRTRWVALSRVEEGLPALYRALAKLDGSDMRMGERVRSWLDSVLPGLSDSEKREQTRMADKVAEVFAEFDTTDVQAKHVMQFLQGFSNVGKLRTAQRYRAMLKKFFAWVVIQGDRQDNPVDPVFTKAPPPLMRHMDDEAFTLIRDKLLGDADHKTATGEMMQCYVDLAYLTGHGGVDIRTLKWSQIGETSIPVTRSKVKHKTGAKVDILITPAIREVLDRAKNLMKGKARLSPYVIHNLEGEPYSAHGVNTAWRRARERAYAEHHDRSELLTFTLKDLRAKFATDAKRQGYTDEQIAAGMAHADTGMTTVYLKQRMAKNSTINLEIPKK